MSFLFAEQLNVVDKKLAADGSLEVSTAPTAGKTDDKAVALVLQDVGIEFNTIFDRNCHLLPLICQAMNRVGGKLIGTIRIVVVRQTTQANNIGARQDIVAIELHLLPSASSLR